MAGLILHVLASDERRGAQAQARLLIDSLNRLDPRHRHEALTIFAGERGNLDAEHALRVPAGLARRMIDPRALARLRRAMLWLAPVAVVAHGSEPLKYLALGAPRGVPLVYHRIGTSGARLTRSWRQLVHRWLVARAAALVAVSKDAADDLAAYTATPVAVIPNLREPSQFPGHPTRTGPLRLLFLGAITSTKHPERFIDAVEHLRAAGHRVEASMVGDGPLLAGLRPRLAQNRIEAPGARPDVGRVLADHDVLVFSSRAEGEGMPGVLIEAGLSGLAVVATEVPGVRDVVLDGETGVVVHTPAELHAALARLAADPPLVARLGAAARQHCRSRFAPDVVAPEWIDLLAVTAARMPDFLVVGTMKSGTTTLFDWLDTVPSVRLPREKEPNWFSAADWPRGFARYRALFSEVRRDECTGEASTAYSAPLSAAGCGRRIAETLGKDVPLVAVVREPVERTRSHYRHEVQRGRERRPFADAVTPDSTYVATSGYDRCLGPYVDRFGSRLLVVRFEDLFGPHEAAWQAILCHLGLPATPRPISHRNETAAKAPFNRPMRALWQSGLYRSIKRLPVPSIARRSARRLLRGDGEATVLIDASRAASLPPQAVAALAASAEQFAALIGEEHPLWP